MVFKVLPEVAKVLLEVAQFLLEVEKFEWFDLSFRRSMGWNSEDMRRLYLRGSTADE